MFLRIAFACLALSLTACMGGPVNQKWDHLDYDRIAKNKMPAPGKDEGI